MFLGERQSCQNSINYGSEVVGSSPACGFLSHYDPRYITSAVGLVSASQA